MHRTARRARTSVLVPLVAFLTFFGYGASTAQAAAVWESCDQWGNWTAPDGYIVYNNIWAREPAASASPPTPPPAGP